MIGHPAAGPATAGHDPVWLMIANVVVWTTIVAARAVWGIQRGRERA